MFKRVLKLAKLFAQILSVVVLSFCISLGIYISTGESLKFPSESELRDLNNVSRDLDSKQALAVNLSRNSVLQVLSGSKDRNGFTKMSGTYVTHDNKFYVITAAHGIVGDCELMFVATSSDGIHDCVRYITIDRAIDYAIVEIEEVKERIPIKLRHAMPSNREWRQETSALNQIFYTGFPNGLGPLTFDGSVAGMSDENYILLHSYAWPGSSGAGVFSYDGNMIGIIIALNVGLTAAGYDVLEDLVIVTPLFMIDWNTAYEIMEEPSPSGDTGDTGE